MALSATFIGASEIISLVGADEEDIIKGIPTSANISLHVEQINQTKKVA